MLSGISQSLEDDIKALPWLARREAKHKPPRGATPSYPLAPHEKKALAPWREGLHPQAFT
jgi:hypothetical protein